MKLLLKIFLLFILVTLGSTSLAQEFRERIKSLDQNGDNQITRDEVRNKEAFDRSVKRFDKNGDGIIQMSEIRSIVGPATYQKNANIAYRKMDGVDPSYHSLDVYWPKSSDETARRPVMVMIHGGGWAIGDKENASMHQYKAPYFVEKGFVYISVNYRLSTRGSNVKHPDHVSDVAAALAWVHDHASEYLGDPDQIFVMGHSAGAHLAALVSTDDRQLKSFDKTLEIIKGTICLDTAGYDIRRYLEDLGARATAKKMYKNAFGETPEEWNDASPRMHVSPNKHIPPMLFFHTGNRKEVETLSKEMVTALRKIDVPAQAFHAKDKNHNGINTCIGQSDDRYTKVIQQFLDDPGSANDLKLETND